MREFKAHNWAVIPSGNRDDYDLIGGFLLVLSVFFVAVGASMKLLLLLGWDPWKSAFYAYGGISITFIVGSLAVYGLFRWARKPEERRGPILRRIRGSVPARRARR